jgi:hypothetical protein
MATRFKPNKIRVTRIDEVVQDVGMGDIVKLKCRTRSQTTPDFLVGYVVGIRNERKAPANYPEDSQIFPQFFIELSQEHPLNQNDYDHYRRFPKKQAISINTRDIREYIILEKRKNL